MPRRGPITHASTAALAVALLTARPASAQFAITTPEVRCDSTALRPARVVREGERRCAPYDIGTIRPDSTGRAPLTTFSDLLQARTPGVSVERSSGTAGTGSRVRIRGVNSVTLDGDPLLIVDGVRVDGTTSSLILPIGGQSPSLLDQLDPEDIERVEILRGPAAAALYGTGAANGVLLVTTKTGSAGGTRWDARTTLGAAMETATFPPSYNQIGLVGSTRVRSCTIVEQTRGMCTPLPDSLLTSNAFESRSPYVTAPQGNVGVSVSGGGEMTAFRAAGNFAHEGGVFEVNRSRRSNVRANWAMRFQPGTEVTIHAGYVNGSSRLPYGDSHQLGLVLNGLAAGPFTSQGYIIPLDSIRLYHVGQDVSQYLAGGTVAWSPFSWLATVTTLGAEIVDIDESEVAPVATTGYQPPRSSSSYHGNGTTIRTAAIGSWRPASAISLRSTIGFERVGGNARGTAVSQEADGSVMELASSEIKAHVTGLYGQLELGWRDRIFASGGMRRDGIFEHDGITYPTLGLSWTASSEPWFPRNIGVSSLRLRSAYGEAGLPAVWLGSRRTRPPDRARETEVGLEAGLLGQRATLELTYYRKRSRDAMAPPFRPTPWSPPDLSARIQNSGVEAQVVAALLSRDALDWRISIAGSLPRNRVLSLVDGSRMILSTATAQEVREGYPMGGYWARPLLGYADLNGDGLIGPETCVSAGSPTGPACEITLGDVTFLGSPYPTRELSLGSRVTLHHRLTLSVLVDHRGGQKLFNATRYWRCWSAVCREIQDRSVSLSEQAKAAASRLDSRAPYIEDASYWKLRELSIELLAPARWQSRLGARRLALTIAARNLFTWTRYTGLDPEVNAYGQDQRLRVDYFTQPTVRHLMTRLDIGW